MIFTDWIEGLALNALVLGLAVLLDRILPEPPAKLHPVVWIGSSIDVLKRFAPQSPTPAFLYGCFIVLVLVGFWGVTAYLLVDLLMSWNPIAYVAGGALMLRATFTVRTLSTAANRTRQTLQDDRLDDARTSLMHLVSRDASTLSGPQVAAAAIESVAENTTDSYVAPWLFFAIFGVPGAVAYRVINTLDSMLGHRGPLEYLGKASAKLDDLVNLVPARLSAMFLLVSGAILRLPAGLGWKIMARDRILTSSPNAGWTMGAMAGLLGSRLEKVGHYCLAREMPEPRAGDITIAVRVSEWTAILALAATLGLLAARHALWVAF